MNIILLHLHICDGLCALSFGKICGIMEFSCVNIICGFPLSGLGSCSNMHTWRWSKGQEDVSTETHNKILFQCCSMYQVRHTCLIMAIRVAWSLRMHMEFIWRYVYIVVYGCKARSNVCCFLGYFHLERWLQVFIVQTVTLQLAPTFGQPGGLGIGNRVHIEWINGTAWNRLRRNDLILFC